VRLSAVIDAFATVPREQFVGPGPWRIKSPMDFAECCFTDDDNDFSTLLAASPYQPSMACETSTIP
jgi:protein-L-isoaspartate O-methyltransferase